MKKSIQGVPTTYSYHTEANTKVGFSSYGKGTDREGLKIGLIAE
jgi:hypothetical protein